MPSTSMQNSQAKPSMRKLRFRPSAGSHAISLADHVAVGQLRKEQRGLHGAAQRDEAGQRRFAVARVGRQKGREHTGNEGKNDEKDQWHLDRFYRATPWQGPS